MSCTCFSFELHKFFNRIFCVELHIKTSPEGWRREFSDRGADGGGTATAASRIELFIILQWASSDRASAGTIRLLTINCRLKQHLLGGRLFRPGQLRKGKIDT